MRMLTRQVAVLSMATMLGGSIACGKSRPPPPVDDTRGGRVDTTSGEFAPTQREARDEKTGISTGQKVVMLAGAAALYYMYKHHQNASAATGPDGQYYLSKNGRVYYRDAEHRAHWVTPPPEGVRVPESEANEYRQFQGYNGRADGRDLSGLTNEE